METMEEMFPQDYEKVVEELESQNFENAVDLVMYFECQESEKYVCNIFRIHGHLRPFTTC